jgi:hypothetical protein
MELRAHTCDRLLNCTTGLLHAHARPRCHGPVTASPRRSPATASGHPYPLVVEAKAVFAFLFSLLSAMRSRSPPALLPEVSRRFSAEYRASLPSAAPPRLKTSEAPVP